MDNVGTLGTSFCGWFYFLLRASSFFDCVAFHFLILFVVLLRSWHWTALSSMNDNLVARRLSCASKKSTDSYIGENARRQPLRTEEYGGKDKSSWIFNHSSSTKHPRAKDSQFEVLASNYDNKRKRRLAEAMYIRNMKPTLNVQKESYKLALCLMWRQLTIWRQMEFKEFDWFIPCNY